MNHPEKSALRRHFRAVRDALDTHDERSAMICARIAALPVYQAAHILHCYLPMRSEVNTLPLLRLAMSQGKRVVVPVVYQGTRELAHSWLESLDESERETGVLGTPQPRSLNLTIAGVWDVIIVPMLAFDRNGYRLGYGGGYYDRLLGRTHAPSVGAAFAVQETTSLHRERHDIPLDWIVTEHTCFEGGNPTPAG